MSGKKIHFIAGLTDSELANYYERAKALLFPQNEDFGMVAVEAQAAGTPVIAFNKGGARDIVKNGKTGIFFDKQNAESLIYAIKCLDKFTFKKNDLVDSAKRFSKQSFKSSFLSLI